MPTKYLMKEGFMFWGVDKNNLDLSIPYPHSGAFESARTVETQDSANGEVVGQMVGRRRDKQNMKWNVMDCEKWWQINRFIDENMKGGQGFSFYCRYFNFNLGKWMTHKCYVGNQTCTPFGINSDQDSDEFGMPTYIRDCSVNVIDCGIVEEEE